MQLIRQHSVKKIITIINLSLLLGLTTTLLSSQSLAQTNSNLLINPSFENPGFSGWQETAPVDESDKAHKGSRSANISGHSGLLEQTVPVTPNTDYVVSAYVFNFGRIGVLIDEGKKEKRIHNAQEWTKAEIEFNSGSASSVKVYANFYREQGSYDNFVFTKKSSIIRPTSKQVTQCPAIGELPISAAYDDITNESNPARNTIDGNLANRWSSKGVGKKITFDLNRLAEVSQLDVLWYKGEERISLFSVETSVDGQNWKMVLPNASSTQMKGFDTYDIENLISPDARLIRIIGNGNSKSEWNSISEVRIKGCIR